MKYEHLQHLAVGLLLGSMLAGLTLLGCLVESKRIEAQQYKEAVADVAEDCIYTRSQLTGVILNSDIDHCSAIIDNLK